MSLNSTTLVVSRGIDGRADRAGPSLHRPITVEHGEGLVDGAVVAPVEHQHLRPSGEMTGEPDAEPVGVGRGHRDLPNRQPESSGQLLADIDGVRRREHRA